MFQFFYVYHDLWVFIKYLKGCFFFLFSFFLYRWMTLKNLKIIIDIRQTTGNLYIYQLILYRVYLIIDGIRIRLI
jgi:hypothetical protein